MIRYTTILTFILLTLDGVGQEKRMLKAVDFADQQVDDQWVIVKYKSGKLPISFGPEAKSLNRSNQYSRLQNVMKIRVLSSLMY